MMACGSRLPDGYNWMQQAVAEYIEEEIGHEQWILNDLEHSGADLSAIQNGRPCQATEIMVAYAYHQIDRVSPLAFFGMVHVLEGTSTALATQTAELAKARLGLPDKAFSYLNSHGSLDIEHVKFFQALMNKIEEPSAQQSIIHGANMFYHLYGEVLSSVGGVK
jgi:pyrroloquinoline quinone (PQQ) biosynthesis protein C